MPNQYRPQKQTVGNLLSTTNPPIVVPDWQRSYSWTSTEVETFWRDLLAFDARYPGENVAGQEYFLGSVVIVDASADHLLLDGQQRLSTAAILLSVIRDYMKRYSDKAATRTQARYLGDFDDGRDAHTYKLTLNLYDREFFQRKILEARDGAYTEPEPTLESHRLITGARVFLEKQFEERYAEIKEPEEAYRWAVRIQDVLTNHMSVVAIFSQDEDNASAVFETLNDRGIGLSTADLVRNLLLRRAHPSVREDIIDLWREILGVENDAALKTFLRHYWVSHYGDVKTQSLYREIKDKVQADSLDGRELSRQLREASLVYRDIVSGQSDSVEVARLLADVDGLGATILYPTILSAVQVLPLDAQPGVLRALITTFVRHTAIGALESSRLENLIFRLARELRVHSDPARLLAALGEFVPSDEAFRVAFGSASVARQSTARYLLRELERSRRTTEELEVALPDKVHVEHIYPQTPLAGQRRPRHVQIVNRLGNLTLLSKRLNQSIQNAAFESKKPSYGASEILITRELADLGEWSESAIEERQAKMANSALALWPLPCA